MPGKGERRQYFLCFTFVLCSAGTQPGRGGEVGRTTTTRREREGCRGKIYIRRGAFFIYFSWCFLRICTGKGCENCVFFIIIIFSPPPPHSPPTWKTPGPPCPRPSPRSTHCTRHRRTASRDCEASSSPTVAPPGGGAREGNDDYFIFRFFPFFCGKKKNHFERKRRMTKLSAFGNT